MTLNEPNIMRILRYVLPPQFVAGQRAMLDAAAKKAGVAKFTAGNSINPEDVDAMTVQSDRRASRRACGNKGGPARPAGRIHAVDV